MTSSPVSTCNIVLYTLNPPNLYDITCLALMSERKKSWRIKRLKDELKHVAALTFKFVETNWLYKTE